ncbi:STAS domain-containing protein [Luteimicrobium subarcticum]|uniref:Anti-anti-sigma factor n=1 Tax=Luteimicrobium subarcticum TaxID=620910 RepID=A0A2M8W486_9MICO|nr:STAS domain-containing protein [Luteimicrobium subarcticum]PJI85719.1 anti-anti-sigma factor [Luteimicrobium subarcticum]
MGDASGVLVQRGGRRWVMWGEIDFALTHRVKKDLLATIDGLPKTIDLSRVTFMDSSGLHLLLMKVTPTSKPRLVRAPAQVVALLTTSGVLDMVELVDHDDSPDDPPPAARAVAG